MLFLLYKYYINFDTSKKVNLGSEIFIKIKIFLSILFSHFLIPSSFYTTIMLSYMVVTRLPINLYRHV